MMEDELLKIWQSSPNREKVKFEKSRLIIEVQRSLDRFHTGVKWRDRMEIGAALLMLPIFSYQTIAFPYLLSKIASGCIVIWLIYVIVRLRGAHKQKPDNLTSTYMVYLHSSRKYLLTQKHLLDTILYWYILPGLSFVTLFILGAQIGEGFNPRFWLFAGTVISAIGVGTFLWNKWAAKKYLVPKLKKVDELIAAMEEEPTRNSDSFR